MPTRPTEITVEEIVALRYLALGNHEQLKTYGPALENLRKLGFAVRRGASWRLTHSGLDRLAMQICGVTYL